MAKDKATQVSEALASQKPVPEFAASKFDADYPEVAALILALATATLLGHNAEEKAAILAGAIALLTPEAEQVAEVVLEETTP